MKGIGAREWPFSLTFQVIPKPRGLIRHDSEALARNFGNLSVAFETLSAAAGAGRVTQEEFERFLKTLEHAAPGQRPMAPGERGQALKSWLESAPQDTRVCNSRECELCLKDGYNDILYIYIYIVRYTVYLYRH